MMANTRQILHDEGLTPASQDIPDSGKVDPRASQKARTRRVIIDSALEMLYEGTLPTVATAAERARVSRATAYRYFPTQEDLGEELARHSPALVAVDEFVASLTTEDVEQRLIQLLDTYNHIVISHEVHMRTTLRTLLLYWLQARNTGDDGSTPVFRTRTRMNWLEQILEPANLPADTLKRLAAALSLTLGIEPFVVLKDACHLEDEEVLDVLRWAATTLLHAALDQGRSSS